MPNLSRGGLDPKTKDAKGTGYKAPQHAKSKGAGDRSIPVIERAGNAANSTGYASSESAKASRPSGQKDLGEVVDRNFSYDKRSVPEPQRIRDGVDQDLKRG